MTYAIMTAEFPARATTLDNNDLQNELVSKGYLFCEVTGHFEGNIENSFAIENISFDEAVALGDKYGQASIIYCNEEDNCLVECTTGKILATGEGRILHQENNLPSNYSIFHFPSGSEIVVFDFKPA